MYRLYANGTHQDTNKIHARYITIQQDTYLIGNRRRRGGGRGPRPPLGEPGPRGSAGGGAAAAHWLPTRPPSTGAAAEMMFWGRTSGRDAVR